MVQIPQIPQIVYDAFTSAGIMIETPSLLASDNGTGIQFTAGISVAIFTLLELLGLPGAKFTPTNDSQPITEWAWATYSFANRTIATNTGVKQPNTIILNMHLVISSGATIIAISSLMVFFKGLIDKYIAKGGLFTVVLPSMTYTGCALTKFEAVDSNDHPSQTYKWSFLQPLISATNLDNLINDSSLDALDNGGVI